MGEENAPSACNLFNYANWDKFATDAKVVWDKFATDALLGTKNHGIEVRLRQQYLKGAPSIDARDYGEAQPELDLAFGSEGGGGNVGYGYDTLFGSVHPRTLAQLSPIYVNMQIYALRLFALRYAVKLQTSCAFVVFRILLPFFLGRNDGRVEIYPDDLSCKTGAPNKDFAVACQLLSYLVHMPRHVAYALLLLCCDVLEMTTVMRRWNVFSFSSGVGGGDSDVGAAPGGGGGVLVNAQHAAYVNRYMRRLLYGFLCMHWLLRSYDTSRMGFLIAFGEFNENYCSGEDPPREAHLCYKYRQEQRRNEMSRL